MFHIFVFYIFLRYVKFHFNCFIDSCFDKYSTTPIIIRLRFGVITFRYSKDYACSKVRINTDSIPADSRLTAWEPLIQTVPRKFAYGRDAEGTMEREELLKVHYRLHSWCSTSTHRHFRTSTSRACTCAFAEDLSARWCIAYKHCISDSSCHAIRNVHSLGVLARYTNNNVCDFSLASLKS